MGKNAPVMALEYANNNNDCILKGISCRDLIFSSLFVCEIKYDGLWNRSFADASKVLTS